MAAPHMSADDTRKELVLGWIGVLTAAAVILFPMSTFLEIQRTHLIGTAEPYSCIAVIVNSAMWLMYGIPTIRQLMNLPVMLANGVGILVELYYVYVFIQHAVGRRRKPVLILLIAAVLIFTVLGVFLGMTVCRHKWPRTFVGDLAAISGVIMYLVPAINTIAGLWNRDLARLSWWQPLAALANGSVWTSYARVGRVRMFILVPSIAAICSAAFQEVSWVIVYFRGPPPAPVPPPPPPPPPRSDIELPPHAAAGTGVRGGEEGREDHGGGDGGQGGEGGKEQLEAQVSAEGQQQLFSEAPAIGTPAPEVAAPQNVAQPTPEVDVPQDVVPPAPEDAAPQDVDLPEPPVVAPPLQLQPQEEHAEIPEED